VYVGGGDIRVVLEHHLPISVVFHLVGGAVVEAAAHKAQLL
jgi:hypothetical protein